MFGNDKLFEALSNRLDQVEEHVAQCATRKEVEDLKSDLKENFHILGEVKETTNRINTEFNESRRWIGIIAGMLVVGIPFVEEVKDALFHEQENPQNLLIQHELYNLKEKLNELEQS